MRTAYEKGFNVTSRADPQCLWHTATGSRSSTHGHSRRHVVRHSLWCCRLQVITLIDCVATMTEEGQKQATTGTFGWFSSPMTSDEFKEKLAAA